MEMVIAIALVAFFWYALYRAWTGRIPQGKRPSKTVVVSHDLRTADHYRREFGMFFDKDTRVATRAEELYGHGSDVEFIYVNSDNNAPDFKVINVLSMLEEHGATVHWVGYDENMEVRNEGTL